MIRERFGGLVGVVRNAEEVILVLDIIRRDIGLCIVEIIKDGTGEGGSVSHVFMTEGTDEHLIHGGEDNLAEGFVGTIILVEEFSSDTMRVA